MKKIILFTIIALLSFCSVAHALEIVRQKNVATYIYFPIVDADGDIVTGAAGLDSEIDAFADGTAPDGFTDCTNEATEIGTSGIYYLSLAQAETNYQYIYIQVKTSTSGAKTQHILIRTTIGAPANMATTDDGGTINVTTGAIDTVTTTTTATSVTNAVVLPTGTGAGQIALSSGAVTVGTNNDKTGYTASTVSDKTGYSLTQAFPTNFSAMSISATTGLVDITQTAADKVWATTARTLTAGTNIALAKGTGVTGFNDIAATDVWSAGTRTLSAGGYSGLTGTDIDNIWDEVTTGHSTSTSFGKLIIDNLNATISSRSSHSAADVATAILVTPANKLTTDNNGKVTVSNPGTTVY